MANVVNCFAHIPVIKSYKISSKSTFLSRAFLEPKVGIIHMCFPLWLQAQVILEKVMTSVSLQLNLDLFLVSGKFSNSWMVKGQNLHEKYEFTVNNGDLAPGKL